ncbi:MAG: hypothetical protein HY367_02025 [Candidatus Aenigmarchaeota archaeon]|nr:hypothetical protein [Candidatus Aenigmarchaeota archaeon]
MAQENGNGNGNNGVEGYRDYIDTLVRFATSPNAGNGITNWHKLLGYTRRLDNFLSDPSNSVPNGNSGPAIEDPELNRYINQLPDTRTKRHVAIRAIWEIEHPPVYVNGQAKT